MRIHLIFLFFIMQVHAQTQNQSLYDMRYVNIENYKMAYVDEGSGPVLFLVHGLPTSSYLYRKIIPQLTEAGYRVIAPDMIGYGASDKPESLEEYTAEKQAMRMLALMDHLDIASWTHVVHDVGGIWSWPLVSQNPDKIENLIILNTILYTDGFKPPVKAKEGGFKAWFMGGVYKNFSWIVVPSTLRSGTCIHKFSREEKRAYRMPVKEGGYRAIKYFFTSFDRFDELTKDARESIKANQIPVCIIWGEKDKFLLAEKQIELAKKELNISEKDIHILPKSKHFIQEDNPDAVSKHILNYLKP